MMDDDLIDIFNFGHGEPRQNRGLKPVMPISKPSHQEKLPPFGTNKEEKRKPAQKPQTGVRKVYNIRKIHNTTINNNNILNIIPTTSSAARKEQGEEELVKERETSSHGMYTNNRIYNSNHTLYKHYNRYILSAYSTSNIIMLYKQYATGSQK